MRVAKRIRLCVTITLALGAASLILGCEGAHTQASSVAEASLEGATRQANLKGPPIPEAGPLARPKPLERTQLSFDSSFDDFIAGEKNAIDDAAKRGWELFNTRGRCNKCHALTEDKRDVTNFRDNDFHTSRWPDRPSSSSTPGIRRPTSASASSDTTSSIAPLSRRTCQRSAAFLSPRKSPISPRSKHRTCAMCW